MLKKTVTVKRSNVGEARPVALLVQTASHYDSEIYIELDNKKVNAKSIMGMMAVGLYEGCEITITSSGHDEDEAVEKIEEYLCDF